MEEAAMTAFQIIMNTGSAKSCYMEALGAAKRGDFAEAQRKIDEGEQLEIEGHKIHTDMVAKEAAGGKTEFSLILIHAEDQMMSTELIKTMVSELMEIYQRGQDE